MILLAALLCNYGRGLCLIDIGTEGSLEEGMEETLTVHKLRVPDQLRRTLSCTNVIESAFSI
jgi:putative transposase